MTLFPTDSPERGATVSIRITIWASVRFALYTVECSAQFPSRLDAGLVALRSTQTPSVPLVLGFVKVLVPAGN